MFAGWAETLSLYSLKDLPGPTLEGTWAETVGTLLLLVKCLQASPRPRSTNSGRSVNGQLGEGCEA